MWKFCSKICDITKFEVNLLVMLLVMLLQVCLCLLLYTYLYYAYFRGLACLYCQRSLNCFYNAYTVYCSCILILSKEYQLLLQCKLFSQWLYLFILLKKSYVIASTMDIPFSAYACLNCQKHLNCFYCLVLMRTYTVKCLNCFYHAYKKSLRSL